MSQHRFPMGGHGANGIDPNEIYSTSYQHNFSGSNDTGGGGYIPDDDLLDNLSAPDQAGLQPHGTFNPLSDIGVGYQGSLYSNSHHGLPMDQARHNGYSSTPDGEPIQSPFVGANFGQYPSMGHHPFGSSLHSPPFNSPLADVNEEDFSGKPRPRLHQAARPQPVGIRTSLTPNNATMGGLSINSDTAYAQPIRPGGAHHEKSHSGQWAAHTPNSLQSLPGSNFSSPPVQAGFNAGAQSMQGLIKGASMPTKLNMPAPVSSQEAKKRRRRESHNLVERRRRDNINERIQDLSKLVPAHRLEDERIRKAIQNGTPLSPTLAGISSPTQATSALAGPGARRAAGVAGNITTGLPIEEKDKGPNKGDILNGAVSWTRDLMWMLHLKLQQQEELINALQERGANVPFEFTDDERRMQTELMEILNSSEDPGSLSYSRTSGSGLRVPHHTNYKGEPLGDGGPSADRLSASPNGGRTPGGGNDMLDDDYLDYDENRDLEFKEEDEFGGMDLTH